MTTMSPRFCKIYNDEREACADFLESQLSPLGFHVSRFTTPTSMAHDEEYMGRWHTSCKKTEIDPSAEFPHLYATTDPNGRNKKRIIFVEHYDVVKATNGDRWKTNPFKLEQEGTRLYGRGASDMKGGIAAHLVALKMYKEIIGKFPSNIAIDIIINSLEEVMSPFGIQDHLTHLINSGRFAPDSKIYLVETEATQSQIANARRMAGVYSLPLANFNPLAGLERETQIFRFTSNGGHAGQFNIKEGLENHSLFLAVENFFNNYTNIGYYPIWLNATPCAENAIPSVIQLGLTRKKSDTNIMLLAAMRFMYELTANTNWQEPAWNSRGTTLSSFFNGKEGEAFLRTFFRSFVDEEKAKRYLDEAVDRTNTYMQRKFPGWQNWGHGQFDICFHAFHTPEASRLLKTASEILAELTKEEHKIFSPFGNGDIQIARKLLTDAGHQVQSMVFGPTGSNEHRANEYVLFDSLVLSALFYYQLMRRFVGNKPA
ncbi:hypothetical protein A3J90_03225 [candidate division WOR-1 bacterium RIFOXYC2_FULL_37_10]|uniref:Peptidase M20 dimerisation domain-containing protein n=1 Tax=candidate division WOR-1 bacterium RIFOXYB2_FULL_37_13 TaxID=1802579 RepID=A0A1F4SDP2_UNCSA|nr:MAG: hypothetical protein A2310_01925 [candidate division WOR-1 bacterium RIFOXYB2_FULL_37_13]OGC36867.1 MAG: hypothetical protein A3J90_03225 [candidate division WOR-1 bacterium RIFOXYC2_FULL_37_10]